MQKIKWHPPHTHTGDDKRDEGTQDGQHKNIFYWLERQLERVKFLEPKHVEHVTTKFRIGRQKFTYGNYPLFTSQTILLKAMWQCVCVST